MESAKFHAKIGDKEITFEGPPELVEKLAKEWLKENATSPLKSVQAPVYTTNDDSQGGDTIMRRAFVERRKGKRDIISLRRLPDTENRERDAFVLILYAYKRMKDVHEMTGGRVLRALRESKLQIERLYKLEEQFGDLITRTGKFRGTKYSLTHRGAAKAEELIKNLPRHEEMASGAK